MGRKKPAVKENWRSGYDFQQKDLELESLHPMGKREEMRSKPIVISPDYLVIRLSTAMYSGIHLCTSVYVIITHRPLYSSTVS